MRYYSYRRDCKCGYNKIDGAQSSDIRDKFDRVVWKDIQSEVDVENYQRNGSY